MLQQNNKESQDCEGKKKLFMKWALNSMRKFFNKNNLPYHLLSTCVSIKPGSDSRCATLQSYPNQGVWKYLHELPENVQNDLKTHLIEETKQVQQKFQQNILIEFQQRVNKNFDFASFYKESKHSGIQTFHYHLENETNDTPPIEEDQKDKQVKQKKWSKGSDFVSESKQILLQMQLCNQHQPLIAVQRIHYHKLRTLLEKIKEQKHKMSEEMKQFEIELERFCKQDFCPLEQEKKKKVKLNNDQQQIQQNENQELKEQICIIKVENDEVDILSSFKDRVRRIEPGIQLYIPNLQKYSYPAREYFQQFEDNYYKELYFKEKVEQMELNPKNILLTWRLNYQALEREMAQQKIEFQQGGM